MRHRRKTTRVNLPGGRRVGTTLAPGYVDLEKEDVRLPSGRRLTDAVVDEFVTGLHRRGRPSLTGRATRSPQIAFRVPPELRARGERLARATGKTLSALAREAFEARVRRAC